MGWTGRRGNNFDLIRLLAALVVLVSHSIPLSYGTDAREAVWRLSGHQATAGRIAVAAFFVISGYLITQSYRTTDSPARFLRARALRLLPGLAAMLVVLATVAGPLLSTLPAAAYFAAPAVPRFVAVNLSLGGFAPGLPGVFAANPFAGVVNGSIWTLRYEAECYGLVLLLGMARLLNRRVVVGLFAASLLASALWWGGVRVEFATYFLGGATVQLWRPPLRRWAAWLCGGVMAASLATGGLRLACASAGAYLVIYLAVAARPVRVWMPWAGRSDLSYGVYLWAFPVQQAATLALGDAASWWANVLVSLPVVLGLAALSWHLVEAPALGFKPLGFKPGERESRGTQIRGVANAPAARPRPLR